MNLKTFLNETKSKDELADKRVDLIDSIVASAEPKMSSLIDELSKEIKKEKVNGSRLLKKEDIDIIKVSILNYFETYLNRKI